MRPAPFRSPARRRVRGVTLVELNVALILAAFILTAISGVFLSTQRMWERTSSQGVASRAGAEAMRRLTTELSQACHVYIYTRFTTNDTLAITYPDTTTADGYFSPRAQDSQIVYKAGSTRRVYYLSDSTGSILAPGNILWTGAVTATGDTPTTVTNNTTPSQTASLWSSTTIGQVQPVAAVKFDSPQVSDPAWLYTVQVTVTEKRSGRSVTRTLVRRVFARFHE